ncbi:MAG: ATP-binding cassette domain-containing protein [Gammaproteobacteria bacterium]|nr:ATP-binding cassette domain-containing protein [Gammaproteobacteria bacterium]
MSLSSRSTVSHAAPSLCLEGYGVAFGDRVVLSRVDLEVSGAGTCVLMGPAGTGKSTLLRSLAGFNESNPGFQSWGQAWINGAPIDSTNRPALIAQSARLVMADVLVNLMHEHPDRATLSLQQQRSIARLTLQRAGMEYLRGPARCADAATEPAGSAPHRPAATAGGATRSDLPRRAPPPAWIQPRPISCSSTSVPRPRVTGNWSGSWSCTTSSRRRPSARRSRCSPAARSSEHAATGQFFAHPVSEAARQFVRTGSCSTLPPPGDPGPSGPPRSSRVLSERGPTRPVRRTDPRASLWLWRGMLAGHPHARGGAGKSATT